MLKFSSKERNLFLKTLLTSPAAQPGSGNVTSTTDTECLAHLARTDLAGPSRFGFQELQKKRKTYSKYTKRDQKFLSRSQKVTSSILGLGKFIFGFYFTPLKTHVGCVQRLLLIPEEHGR